MAKVRIYEMAKETGVPAEEIINRLRKQGVAVKSNLSAIDKDTASSLREALKGVAGAAPAAPAKAAPKKAAPRKATAAKAPVRKTAAKKPPVPEKPEPRSALGRGTGPVLIPASKADEARAKQQAQQQASQPVAPPGGAAAARPPVARPAGRSVAPGAAAARPPLPRPAGARPPIRPSTTGRPGAPGRPLRPGAPGTRRPPGAPGARPAGRVMRSTTGAGAGRTMDRGRPGMPGQAPGRGAGPGAGRSAPGRGRPGGGRGRGAPPRNDRGERGPRGRKRREPPRAPQAVAPPPVPLDPSTFKDITLTEGVTVKALAEKMELKSKDVIGSLMRRGVLVTINQPMDTEIATQICAEFGFNPEFVSFEQELIHEEVGEDLDAIIGTEARAPVVTMMGHVDHGKTSLLDAIRETTVAEREHGGITQHIGAYHVDVNNRRIVFLDTPGHEAFTRMRARGAQVTDLVVLVVAADDGVMPQTVEAIHHARAAKVPIIVAINKMDKAGANIDNVKKALANNEILVEDWGGDVVAVPVSAKAKTGLDSLMEMILLSADIRELKANPDRLASGTVLEARLDRARGPVATVLVQQGTLKVGDAFIVGAEHGRVRAMVDDRGNRIEATGPSTAVEVLGLEGVPEAGETFQALAEEARARQIGAYRQEKARRERLLKSSRMSLDHLFDKIKAGDVKELRVILKTDVQGSAEVLTKTLQELGTEKVQVKVIHSATGAVNDSDVLLATASNAIIVGFSVRPERSAQALAEQEGIDIRLYTVIYNITKEIKAAMLGLLDPTLKEKYLGRAEVRATFKVPKAGVVAGCSVQDGIIKRTSQVRLLRDNVVIHEGKVGSLRRFKEDTNEVREGFECGIGLEKYNDIKDGDIIEAFIVEKVAAKEL